MLDEKNQSLTADTIKNSCECASSPGLCMPSRQVSLVVAALILLSFMLFVGGFFWGQKNAIVAFTHKIEQETFGDQIYSSLCSLCDSEGDVEDPQESSEEEAADSNLSEITTRSIEPGSAQGPDDKSISDELTAESSHEQPQQEVEVEETTVGTQEYYGQLAGFGTARAAQQFANRLQRKEIGAMVKKRQSRSSRGRFVSWYQVVTEKFSDKGDLEALVKRLEYEEKLKDVRIVNC